MHNNDAQKKIHALPAICPLRLPPGSQPDAAWSALLSSLAASLLNLYFLQRFAMSNFHGIGAPQWILISLSTAAICYCAYTNYMLLAGKREQQKRHFFRYNLWFNIIQIPNFNLFGVMMMINLGIKCMPYISNAGGIDFGIDIELFEMQVVGQYSAASTAVYFGLNIIPIFIAIQLDRALQGIREDEEDKEVAEFLAEAK